MGKTYNNHTESGYDDSDYEYLSDAELDLALNGNLAIDLESRARKNATKRRRHEQLDTDWQRNSSALPKLLIKIPTRLLFTKFYSVPV